MHTVKFMPLGMKYPRNQDEDWYRTYGISKIRTDRKDRDGRAKDTKSIGVSGLRSGIEVVSINFNCSLRTS